MLPTLPLAGLFVIHVHAVLVQTNRPYYAAATDWSEG
jgi:hypothetical protein